MRWKDKGRSRKVSAGQVAKIDLEKFKSGRSALLAFAHKHPGALTAHFLQAVRMKVKGASGVVNKSGQLREVDMSSYLLNGGLGLTEIRDSREAVTLGSVMDAVNRRDLSRAMDIISMRLQALATAKRKGGSWEEASKIELIAETGADVMAAGVSGIAS